MVPCQRENLQKLHKFGTISETFTIYNYIIDGIF